MAKTKAFKPRQTRRPIRAVVQTLGIGQRCLKCEAIVEKLLPKVSKNARHQLLLACTCFPLGSCAEVQRQVRELAKNSDGTFSGCFDLAQAEAEKQMVSIELVV